MLEDEFLPAYDVADAVAVVVHANAGTTWAALMASTWSNSDGGIRSWVCWAPCGCCPS